MPIFAYRCESCGFEKDVLQKRSDPPLVTCPACSQASLVKKLTAPAFQLKGNGWYATDFRDKGAAKPQKPASGDGESAAPQPDAGAAKTTPERAGAPAAPAAPAADSAPQTGQAA